MPNESKSLPPDLPMDFSTLKEVMFPNKPDSSWRASLHQLTESLTPHIRPLAASLLHNIESVYGVAGLPLVFAQIAQKDKRLALVTAGQRMLAQYRLDEYEHEDEGNIEQAVSRRAREKLDDEWATVEAQNNATTQAIYMLYTLTQEGPFLGTTRDLLRQSTVLTWGALEVLADDLFQVLLDSRPQLVTRLRDDEASKKLFSFKSIPFEVLEESLFDLSTSMGKTLLAVHRIDTIPTMKTVFGVLFKGDPSVLTSLSQASLYLLNQRRNLIVHRLGVVDEEYLRRTKDVAEIGSQLLVTAVDLKNHLDAVCDAGAALLNAASAA